MSDGYLFRSGASETCNAVRGLDLRTTERAIPRRQPRIISDNGPQFVARDFTDFIRLCGMTHVRTSPYYPQSNGKLERVNQTLKVDAIRPGAPSSLEEGREIVDQFVRHYNERRLHSAIGYITPADKLAGREAEIWAVRDQRLEAARDRRKQRRAASLAGATPTTPLSSASPSTP
jgi:putative transposase